MPLPLIKSFAKKSGKTEQEVEKLWDELKDRYKDDFEAIVGSLKKILNIKESKMNESVSINLKELPKDLQSGGLLDDLIDVIKNDMKIKFNNSKKVEVKGKEIIIYTDDKKAEKDVLTFIKDNLSEGKEMDEKELLESLTTNQLELLKEYAEKEGLEEISKEDIETFLEAYKKVEEASGNKEEYEKFFNDTLDKYGVKSPNELSDEEKKKFFDEIDAGWEGKGEKPEMNESFSFNSTLLKIAEDDKVGFIKDIKNLCNEVLSKNEDYQEYSDKMQMFV